MDINALREEIMIPKRNISMVLLHNHNDEILLVRTKRLPDKWQPVGGGMEKDETPEQACVREVREETKIQLNIDDVKEVFDTPYDFGEGTIHCFITNKRFDINELQMDSNEIVEYRFFTLEAASKLPTYNATSSFINYIKSN